MVPRRRAKGRMLPYKRKIKGTTSKKTLVKEEVPTEIEFWEWARAPLMRIRLKAAKAGNLPNEIAELLSEDRSIGVLSEVAKQKNLCEETRIRLSKHKDRDVRAGVAENPETKGELLNKMLFDKDNLVVGKALQNPNLDGAVMEKIITSKGGYLGVSGYLKEVQIGYYLARNPKFPEKQALELFEAYPLRSIGEKLLNVSGAEVARLTSLMLRRFPEYKYLFTKRRYQKKLYSNAAGAIGKRTVTDCWRKRDWSEELVEEARAFSKIGHIGQLMLKAETDRELKAAGKLANFKSNPGSAIGYYFPQQKDEWLIFEEATVFNRQKIIGWVGLPKNFDGLGSFYRDEKEMIFRANFSLGDANPRAWVKEVREDKEGFLKVTWPEWNYSRGNVAKRDWVLPYLIVYKDFGLIGIYGTKENLVGWRFMDSANEANLKKKIEETEPFTDPVMALIKETETLVRGEISVGITL